MVGICIFLVFTVLAIAGPLIAPYSYTEQVPADRLQSPSLQHPFGTDQFGRDILSRVIVGTRSVFVLGGLGTLFAVAFGTPIGLICGYYRGLWDEVVMRLLDVFLAIPSLLLALVLLSTVGPSPANLVVVVAILYTPIIARVVRSMALDLRNKEFVEAAHVRGEGKAFIFFREILPQALPPLLVEASMRFSYQSFSWHHLAFLALACNRLRLIGGCRSTRRETSSARRLGCFSSQQLPSRSS